MKLFKSKKAQLGLIEGKFFLFGLIAGIVVGFVLIYLANHGIFIPFKLSFLCLSLPAPWMGMKLLKSKKAQLAGIEAKFAVIGFFVGILLVFVVTYLANNGILIPFKMGFLCPPKVPVK